MRQLVSLIYKHLKFFEELLNSLSVALLLLTAMYIWLNCPLNFVMEETFTKATAMLGNAFISNADLPYTMDDVLFIDVGRSSELLQAGDGTRVIADRAKLDTLFQLLHQYPNPQRMVTCDLYFDLHSAADSALARSIAMVPNLLSTINRESSGKLIPNVVSAGTIGVPGFRPYRAPFFLFANGLVKFNLTDVNCRKTLPLLMYEKVNHVNTYCLGDALHIGKDWFSNTVLINERLTLNVSRAAYEDQVIPIKTFLEQVCDGKADVLADLKRKRFVMIGDFEGDIHKTTFGDKPGPVILFDIFLSLQRKENQISTLWVLFALVFFTALTYKKFYHVNLFKSYNRWLDDRMRLMGFKQALEFNWLIFYGFVLFSAVFFQVYMELVAGVVFFNILAISRIYIKTRRLKWIQFRKSGRRMNLSSMLTFLFRKPGFKN